jgi:MarR family transcriptional regulator, transcriptional regulator for hemolysin
MKPALPSDISSNPVPLINIGARTIARLGERRLKPFGVSAGQIPVLYLLRNGDAMSQKELAQAVRIEQPSMAQMLVRMERDGLIRRTPDPDDGRSALISLTKEALEKLPAARRTMAEGNKRTLAGFSSDEIATLVALMRRLNDNLDRMLEEEEATSS